MAKRGGPRHVKRITVPMTVPIHDKKNLTWIIKSNPGPHNNEFSMPLGVLLRDVLKVAMTSREVGIILSNRAVLIDGKIRTEERFPVGLMDVITLNGEKNYRIILDPMARLQPVEINNEDAKSKILRVVRKHTVPGGKTALTFHDGRNIISDNHLNVGDSVKVALPKVEFKGLLKREKGARCLVIEGKHAGSYVQLKDIMERKGGKPNEALVQEGEREFITLVDYLFVVGE